MTNFCDGLISIYLLKCILRNSLHVFVARTRMKLKQLSRLRHLRCMVVMVPKMWDRMFLIKRKMKKVKNVRCPLVSVKALYWVYMLALCRSLIQTVGQSIMNVEFGVPTTLNDLVWLWPDALSFLHHSVPLLTVGKISDILRKGLGQCRNVVHGSYS